MMTNCIEVRGLCKRYAGFALDHIDLSVPGGSILGLIGENGAGKTTTIKCILNLVRRDAGEITLLGRDSIREELQIKQDVGIVLDECVFHDTLRAWELDRILGPVYRSWDSALFRDYLNKFRLPERQFIKEYSRGMKMKLSLAAALAHRPRLLVLDEATSGLDPVVRDEILEEFRAFACDEEHAVLLSSHITSDLEKVADYITYIHRGQVRLSGAKDELLEHYGRLVCTARQLEELEPGELVQVRRGAYGCEGLVADREAFVRRHPELTVDRVTLEEIMLFIGRGEAQ